MSRFSDEPIKSPLAGNEQFPATDPSTGDDISATPLIITQFAQQNMGIATGSTQGLVSGPNGDKLAALYSKAQLDSEFTQLKEVAFPLFVGGPSDGAVSIYQHVLADINWTLVSFVASVSAGSTNVAITINGVNVIGLSGIPITTAGVGATASGVFPNQTLQSNDVLGYTLSGTTGNCKNLRLSMLINAVTTL